MSRTTMYIIAPDGNALHYKEYGNSWGFAAYIWDRLYDKYLKNPAVEYDSWLSSFNKDEGRSLWNLVENEAIEEHIRTVHLSTMDYAIIEYDKLKEMAKFYRLFLAEYCPKKNNVCHLEEIASDFDKISVEYEGTGCVGVCFQQTSVAENVWYIYSDEDGRPYNINLDDKHWFVFEDMQAINEKLAAQKAHQKS